MKTFLTRWTLRLVVLAAFWALAPFLWAADLKVTLVNVGVGDAILVQTPGGNNILIDGGYEGPGESVLIPYLKAAGVTHIHHMVATHRDLDHIGGLRAVLADTAFTIDEVVYKDTGTVASNRLNNVGSRPTLVLSTVTTTATTLDWDAALGIKVLSAREGQSPSNNNSIVLKVTYGQVSFLLTGDIQTPVMDDVVHNFPSEFPVTILKVPHHGSNSSISGDFPAKAAPKLALISAAKDTNNNPDDSTLEKYEELAIPVIRTDQRGHITVTTNGVSYSVSTTLVPAGSAALSEEPVVHVYPNPAPGATSPAKATVVYGLNGPADDVRVAVYTLAGELVREWSGAPGAAGNNYLDWDLANGKGEKVVSGLYLVQVSASAGGGSQTGRAKMAVLRK